jgi:hypothetical protein
MRGYLRIGSLAVLILSCSSAFAADKTWAVAAKAGSLGVGADIHRVIFTDRLNLRVGVSYFQRAQNFTNSGIRYIGTLRVGAIPVSLDAYPFKNWFRVQAGMLVNLTRLRGDGQFRTDQVSSGLITIGAHSYTPDSIGSLQGTVNVDRVSPFFGLGFGNPIKKDKRWGIFMDIGAVYHGTPTLNLQTTRSYPASLPADLDAQEQSFTQSKAHRYIFYPIVQLGVSFR